MPTDKERLDWLEMKGQERRVYLDDAGWITLDRDSIDEAMALDQGK